MYNQKVLQHFRDPHNFGKMPNPDGVGKVGNIVCGDVMQLYIKVDKDRIVDIKFETFGCAAALATSSVITDLAKGKTLNQALKIDKNKVVKSLGSLPPIKIHCSLLATDALNEAIYDYLSKNKREIPKDLLEKHERIKKEKRLIEEKYREWIQQEESILKR